VSLRGEIAQQFKINKMLAEEGELSPAAFSHSVFNTPPAAAAIALDLRAGNSALYPRNFMDGFLAAAAPVLAGAAGLSALVYADERCPEEYGSLRPGQDEALAFAALLCPPGGIPGENAALGAIIPLCEIETLGEKGPLASPREFLRFLWSRQ
jgi:hypothetical protein